MFENLAAKGIKQNGHPDIETIKQYHPEVLCSLVLLMKKMDMGCGWLTSGVSPECLVSGYRDQDVGVKNSAHFFGIALDIMVSKLSAFEKSNREKILDEQLRWIQLATSCGLFTRAGIYPQQNTIHLDIADDTWMKEYSGTPFWVKWDGKYTGFYSLNEATRFSRQLIFKAEA
jgi:hypothetical protein